MTKTVNYTPEMVQILTEAAPVNYEEAKVLADQFGKSLHSIISKLHSLELEYIAKPPTPKRPKGLTKAQLLEQIENALANEEGVPNLRGLEKSTSQALSQLLNLL